jgi:hypothetical protein
VAAAGVAFAAGGDGGVGTVTAMGIVTDNNPLKAAVEEAAADAAAAMLVAIAMKTTVATATTMTTKVATAAVTAEKMTTMNQAQGAAPATY